LPFGRRSSCMFIKGTFHTAKISLGSRTNQYLL
jgi:hypothetical protein